MCYPSSPSSPGTSQDPDFTSTPDAPDLFWVPLCGFQDFCHPFPASDLSTQHLYAEPDPPTIRSKDLLACIGLEKYIGASTYEFLSASVRCQTFQRSQDRSLFGTLRRTDTIDSPLARKRSTAETSTEKTAAQAPVWCGGNVALPLGTL